MRAKLKTVKMMKAIFKVVQQGEAFAVQSKQNENGQTMKCNIVLQELGGKFEDQFVGSMLGNMASSKFYAGMWWRLRCVSLPAITTGQRTRISL